MTGEHWAIVARGAREIPPEQLARVGGTGGIILLDREGRVAWGHISPDFAVAWADDGSPPTAATRREKAAP